MTGSQLPSDADLLPPATHTGRATPETQAHTAASDWAPWGAPPLSTPFPSLLGLPGGPRRPRASPCPVVEDRAPRSLRVARSPCPTPRQGSPPPASLEGSGKWVRLGAERLRGSGLYTCCRLACLQLGAAAVPTPPGTRPGAACPQGLAGTWHIPVSSAWAWAGWGEQHFCLSLRPHPACWPHRGAGVAWSWRWLAGPTRVTEGLQLASRSRRTLHSEASSVSSQAGQPACLGVTAGAREPGQGGSLGHREQGRVTPSRAGLSSWAGPSQGRHRGENRGTRGGHTRGGFCRHPPTPGWPAPL